MEPKKSQDKRRPATAGRGSAQVQFALETGEGTAFVANAYDILVGTSGVTMRFGHLDPQTRRCTNLAYVHSTILALHDLMMRGGVAVDVMQRWAAVGGDPVAPGAAFDQYPGSAVVASANSLVAAIGPLGARLAFQWLDPHALTLSSEVHRARHTLTVQLPPEACARVWLDLHRISESCFSDAKFAHLKPIDARFQG